MKSLEKLKEEEKLLKELIKVYEELERLGGLDEEHKKQYEDTKKKLKNVSLTIHNLELDIDYTSDELEVLMLPAEEQEIAWLELLEKSDFSKDSILRICSLLKADGLLPMLKSDGIRIGKLTAEKAVKLLESKGYSCLHVTTFYGLVETKKKIKKGLSLSGDEIIYKEFLDVYDDSVDDISGKCVMRTHDHFVTLLHDKYEKSGDLEDRADYLLDRVIMELYFGGTLASGEKEFIAQYFEEKKKVV